MRRVVCRFVPKGYAINIFGTVWARTAAQITDRVIYHERIHSAQQRELLWLPFYLLYFAEWLVLLIRYRNWDRAYRSISFEREAYSYDQDPTYLERRRLWAMWRKKR